MKKITYLFLLLTAFIYAQQFPGETKTISLLTLDLKMFPLGTIVTVVKTMILVGKAIYVST